ncbi:DNA-directed DNA polymerase [Tanacetum coccineum]
MTPAARIKAIDELSKHSLSWYKEEEYKKNDFDRVLKHINDFEHNISVLNEEVRMVQHQYKTPNDERDSLLEETISSFIKEAHWMQKKSQNFNLGRIAESIHGREVGTLPSFTETNPRGLAHAITTRKSLEQMPKYAKFMKDLLSKKGKGSEASKNILNEQYSAVIRNKAPPKEKDLGGDLKPTRMCIDLANKTTQFPKGIAENVMVKIDKFVFPVDFEILDMEEDHRIPIILGRPFLATTHA